MKEKIQPMEIPSFVDLMDRSIEAYLLVLTSWTDPGVTKYAVNNLLPYDCNIGRTSVYSPDEYAITLHCKVKGVRYGELVLQGIFNIVKETPRRTTIFIQYDGHPETLGYDFKSITEAIAVLRLYSAGKIRGAQNRLRRARE